MATTGDKSLDILREIILRKDKEKLKTIEADLNQLKNQIADKESLLASLDPVIADLLERKIHSSKDDMARALAPVMSAAIKQQIADAKDDVVDALYPIIGKTIRKSIAEAMKNLVSSINERIEAALKNRLFGKRLQARLTGVSRGELLLKEALPFRVEEIFLIHKETGLLLAHVTDKHAETTVNQELIGGMLTAIRDFVSEAFKTKSTHDLDEILYGDVKIILEIGRYSYLAVVVSGVEPANFRKLLHQLDRQIHSRFYRVLRKFDGNITQLGGITLPLKRFTSAFLSASPPPKPESRPYVWYALGIFLFLLFSLLAILKLPDYISDRKLSNTVSQRLTAIPQSERQHVKWNVKNSVIYLAGYVNSEPIRSQIDSLAKTVAGARDLKNQLKVGELASSEAEIYRQIQQKISQYGDLKDRELRFILEGDCITIEGQVATVRQKREIGYRVSEVPGIRIVHNNLILHQFYQTTREDLRKFLNTKTIFFIPDGDTIQDDQLNNLNAVKNIIKDVPDLQLIIKGYSDNLSNPAYNLQLSKQRAYAVASYLTSHGLSVEKIAVEYFGEINPIAPNDTESGRAQNRRVEFDILEKR